MKRLLSILLIASVMGAQSAAHSETVRIEAEDAKACRVDGKNSVFEHPRSTGTRVLLLEKGSRATVSASGRAAYLCLSPTFSSPGPSYDRGTGTKIRCQIDTRPAQDIWLATSPQIVSLGEDLPSGQHQVEVTVEEGFACVDAFIFSPELLSAVHGVLTADDYTESLTDVRADLYDGNKLIRSEYLRNPINGTFVLLDIAPGKYRLRFSANGWSSRDSQDFTISRPGAKVDLGVIVLSFDQELVQHWSHSATTVRFRRTFNVSPGGSFQVNIELAAPLQSARLVSQFKTIELKVEDALQTITSKSHDPVHSLIFRVPASTPHDMYALETEVKGASSEKPNRWPQTVCVRETLPASFAVAGIGHGNTWGQQTSEYLAQMAELAQLGGARTLLISNEVNAAYIAGALKDLRIPYQITSGNHTMSRWDDFFPQRSQAHDDGPMRIVTFGNDINYSWSEPYELLTARADATVRILACFEAHPPIDLIREGKVNLLFDAHGGGEHAKFDQFPPRTFHRRPPNSDTMVWFPLSHAGVAASIESPKDLSIIGVPRRGKPPLRVECSGANDGSDNALTARIINESRIPFPGARLRLIMRSGKYSLSGAKHLQQFGSDDGRFTIIDAGADVPPDTIAEVVAKETPPLAAADAHHEVVAAWPALPEGHKLGLCAGIDVDSKSRVFVFHRGDRVWSNPFPTGPIATPAVSVIDGQSGKLITQWGAGRFIMPHGLTIDHEDNVWLTDVGLHQVFKFTPEGELLLTLGERGQPGADHSHFNLPTDVAVLPDGSFYVSDGYKNTRVVKFTTGGEFDFEWGSKGSGPGQFNLPHGIAVDARGRVYVCDRTNSRVQVFDAKGGFLNHWQGPHIGRPYGVGAGPNGHIFIIDGGEPSLKQQQRGKAVELDSEGRVIDTFGAFGKGPGEFQMGHDIAIGSDGAVYVAEGAGARVQKFVRPAPTRQ